MVVGAARPWCVVKTHAGWRLYRAWHVTSTWPVQQGGTRNTHPDSGATSTIYVHIYIYIHMWHLHIRLVTFLFVLLPWGLVWWLPVLFWKKLSSCFGWLCVTCLTVSTFLHDVPLWFRLLKPQLLTMSMREKWLTPAQTCLLSLIGCFCSNCSFKHGMNH